MRHEPLINVVQGTCSLKKLVISQYFSILAMNENVTSTRLNYAQQTEATANGNGSQNHILCAIRRAQFDSPHSERRWKAKPKCVRVIRKATLVSAV